MTTDSRLLQIESYRGYLLVLASLHMGKQLRDKMEPADIVQQAMLDAHRAIDQFRGTTESEWKGWLRQILTNQILQSLRGLGRAKRDPTRERALLADMDASASRLDHFLIADQTSPSMKAQRNEDTERLASALLLLPDGQREVVMFRHLQGLSLAEIGERMGRSQEAVAGLLKRGTQALREFMQREHE